ncbi:uncharacterized protein LOC114579961 [Dendrobium catenatum]|uniref:uncharacterized protein LOC114579961 n=1 Tax=Dendrobium catenatum TaxID=906689 RepID=UPI0010A04705|nr:uncharacterized protein LOC114579961 [Dendrobium catenatum]
MTGTKQHPKNRLPLVRQRPYIFDSVKNRGTPQTGIYIYPVNRRYVHFSVCNKSSLSSSELLSHTHAQKPPSPSLVGVKRPRRNSHSQGTPNPEASSPIFAQIVPSLDRVGRPNENSLSVCSLPSPGKPNEAPILLPSVRLTKEKSSPALTDRAFFPFDLLSRRFTLATGSLALADRASLRNEGFCDVQRHELAPPGTFYLKHVFFYLKHVADSMYQRFYAKKGAAGKVAVVSLPMATKTRCFDVNKEEFKVCI